MKIMAVEYNTWNSIIDSIGDRVLPIAQSHGISNINVVPSYPKDMVKFHKPSIVVHRVSSDIRPLAFGGVLGTIYDADNDVHLDVVGSMYTMTYQLDIVSNSNMQCVLLSDIIKESYILSIVDETDDYNVVLNDYTSGSKGEQIGDMQFDHNIDTSMMSVGVEGNYINGIRFDVNVVYSKIVDIDANSLIDLSKGYKINQIINVKED